MATALKRATGNTYLNGWKMKKWISDYLYHPLVSPPQCIFLWWNLLQSSLSSNKSSSCMRAVHKVCGLTLLLQVGT